MANGSKNSVWSASTAARTIAVGLCDLESRADVDIRVPLPEEARELLGPGHLLSQFVIMS
jgi:hypothetical protein